MSKVKLLLDVIANMRGLADSIQAVADAIGENKQPEPVPAPEPPKPEPAVKLEQVRAVLAEKSQSGKTSEVRELLKKHGADRLSIINQSEYPALLKEAEML